MNCNGMRRRARCPRRNSRQPKSSHPAVPDSRSRRQARPLFLAMFSIPRNLNIHTYSVIREKSGLGAAACICDKNKRADALRVAVAPLLAAHVSAKWVGFWARKGDGFGCDLTVQIDSPPSMTFRFAKRHQTSARFIPQDEPDGAYAIKDRHPADICQDWMVA